MKISSLTPRKWSALLALLAAAALTPQAAAESANGIDGRGQVADGKSYSLDVAYLIPFDAGVTLPGYRVAMAVTANRKNSSYGGIMPVVMTEAEAPTMFKRYGTSGNYGNRFAPVSKSMRGIVCFSTNAKGTQFNYFDITGKESKVHEAVAKALSDAEGQAQLQDAKKLAAQINAAAQVSYIRYGPIR